MTEAAQRRQLHEAVLVEHATEEGRRAAQQGAREQARVDVWEELAAARGEVEVEMLDRRSRQVEAEERRRGGGEGGGAGGGGRGREAACVRGRGGTRA